MPRTTDRRQPFRLPGSTLAALFAAWISVTAADQLELPPPAESIHPPATTDNANPDPEDSLEGVSTADAATVFRDALRNDPEMTALLREEVDIAVAARLAGIPRPRYLPTTGLVPGRGLELYRRGNDSPFPFSHYWNGFMQVRWFEFARSATEWVPSSGPPPLPINNINTFNINRLFITTEGHVLDERLNYQLTLFGTTDYGSNSSIVPLGGVGWKFNDHVSLFGGVTFVAGTREWATSSRWVLGIDRSMANTFFRPSYSPGVEFQGNLVDGELTWRAGIWNAIDGSLAGVNRQGTAMAWAGIITWEPLARYGVGYSDMEIHESPAIRVGCSGVHALSQAVLATNGNNPEDTIVRLSDGTPIAAPGALGPGSQVDQFRLQLATIDAGWKHRGVAVNFEYYFRLLDDFVGTGPFRQQSLFDQGGLGYVSWCFVPRTYEVYARSSAVTGVYGTGQEYGGGFNWYLKKSRHSKLTLEALHYNSSPADNTLYPYRAGYSGTAIQTQWLVVW
jgi:hypothetical protein